MKRTDFLSQALNATHTYGAPETTVAYRDSDGVAFHPTATPQTVTVHTFTRRRVTTTYPDGTTAQGWETLSETTAPYNPNRSRLGPIIQVCHACGQVDIIPSEHRCNPNRLEIA